MSDERPLGDWWLASDGRWYPPEARPAPTPVVAPPPPVPGYDSLPTLAPAQIYSDVPRPPGTALRVWLQSLCWIAAGLLTVLAASCLATAVTFQQYWTSSSVGGDRQAKALDWRDMEEFASGVYGFALTVWLVAIILMMVWMNKAYNSTARLWPAHRTWSSGWCVGGWFIPLANLVIPKSVMLEIERSIDSVDERGDLDVQWRDRRGSAIGWVFWFGVVVACLLAFVGNAIRPVVDAGFTEWDADSYVASTVVFAVGALIGAMGALFGGLYFRVLGQTLTAAATRRTDAITGHAAVAFA